MIGNVSMYQICAAVSDNVGFKYKETREACYMPLGMASSQEQVDCLKDGPFVLRVLYFVSVCLNIVLDLVLLAYPYASLPLSQSRSASNVIRMTYYMSFAIMVHLGFRTHDGIPLSKLPFFVQRFEVPPGHLRRRG